MVFPFSVHGPWFKIRRANPSCRDFLARHVAFIEAIVSRIRIRVIVKYAPLAEHAWVALPPEF